MVQCDTSLADMRAARRISRLADLAALPVARDAALEEPELAAVVLYTGPMVSIDRHQLRVVGGLVWATETERARS